MYKCKHFKIYELVDKKTFETTPEWKLWVAFDDRLLKLIDFLREEFGVSITINSWKWGGDRQWSGLRTSASKWYSPWSQHSFGRAVDMRFKGITAPEIRKQLKEMMVQGKLDHITTSITCEENKGGVPISWVHLDVRSAPKGYNGFDI